MSNNSLKQTFVCLSILDKLGYFAVSSNADKILHKSIGESLEQMGKSFSKALVSAMCSLQGLSENELFANYDLFDGSSLTARDILSSSLTIDDILKNTADREVLKFVSELPTHEHILFL